MPDPKRSPMASASPPVVKQVTRLMPHVYRLLEKECPRAFANETTSETQAGFLLGVQFVLQKLREGFTHEEG